MDRTHQRNIVHLLNRAGFGPSPNDVHTFTDLSIEQAVDKLFSESNQFKELKPVNPKRVPFLLNLRKLEFKERRVMRRRMKAGKKSLNFVWLREMAFSRAQLREKMALFWHDHFACNVSHSLLVQKQIHTIRSHALGYFGDLVVEMSRDPAMIEYLNNKQNVKEHPNENFGRELLELFTIGIGNYSEKDIKEAARAFTGWRYNKEGQFYIDKKQHDNGVKSFMGRNGTFTGDDVIDIILENPRTGEYVASKIFQFLSGKPPGPDCLEELNHEFYRSGYHIGTLVRKILTDSTFYTDEIIGHKIKSPIELIAGLLRITNSMPSKGTFTHLAQERLRQVLLSPPDVSGWKSDKQWIDIGTLAERLNLPSKLLRSQIELAPGSTPLTDEGDDQPLHEFEKNVEVRTNLIPLKQLSRIPNKGEQVYNLAGFIFSVNTDHLSENFKELNKKYRSGKIEFKDVLVHLLSLPEYQVN